jgi:hypothetical protein
MSNSPTKKLPYKNFFVGDHKVFPDQYVTSINGGVNVTEQRGTPK